jgi:hypothetical protein
MAGRTWPIDVIGQQAADQLSWLQKNAGALPHIDTHNFPEGARPSWAQAGSPGFQPGGQRPRFYVFEPLQGHGRDREDREARLWRSARPGLKPGATCRRPQGALSPASRDRSKFSALLRELPWTQNLIILGHPFVQEALTQIAWCPAEDTAIAANSKELGYGG